MNIFLIQSQKIKFLLLLSLLVQVYFSIVQVGFYHPDQHFQIIEFSSHQLHQPSYATKIWEFNDMIRPTIQVYFFSGFQMLCNFLSITNPFTIVTLIQLITGLLSFILFNKMALHYLKNTSQKTIFWVLLMLNFSWCFAYERTLFSSETYGALLFFYAMFFYDTSKSKSLSSSIFTGFLLGLAFYARFQMAFAMVGFGIWILFIQKQIKPFIFLAIGFLISIALNVFLDYHFYHKLVFTPYNYFYKNIVEGVANHFGKSSFTRYIYELMAIVLAPFASLILFIVYLKASYKNFKHVVVLSVLFFIVGHCLVAHKEERFLFPILCVMPIIIGLEFDSFFVFLNKLKGIKKIALHFLLCFGLILNFFLLVVFAFTPYSQTIYFEKQIVEKFKNQQVNIYSVKRDCFNTESDLYLTYYKKSVTNIDFIKLTHIDSFLNKPQQYFITTYNDIKDNKKKLESLGAKEVLTSSTLLWSINNFLFSKDKNTINDIWMLYELPIKK